MMKRQKNNTIEDLSVKNAYETIIANMKTRFKDLRGINTLLLTSCNAYEGKSTIANGLAVYCARNGIKTILVDCDLRRRKDLVKIINKSPGLVECLEDGALLEKAIVKKDENLFYLQRGRETDKQIKLLMSEEFEALINNLESQYDLVLLDGSSLADGSDSPVISAKTDGVILVVARGMTTFKQLDDAAITINSFGKKILGVILNEAGSKKLSNRAKRQNL